jgi:hypothetical protein
MQSAESVLIDWFEGCDEVSKMLIGDAPQPADLDALELTGSDQLIDLVPPYVQQFGYFLDFVRLQMPHLPLCGSCRL